jgi:hypothetical protein
MDKGWWLQQSKVVMSKQQRRLPCAIQAGLFP